jgi:hypothetical protein
LDDRRSTPRTVPGCDVAITVGSNRPARLVDISPAGAHLELATPLHPSHTCRISVPLADGDVKLMARVAHCKLTAPGPAMNGGSLVYRAGLEFLDVDRAVIDAITTAFCPPPVKPRRTGPIKVKINVDALERAAEQSGHGTN